MTLDEINNLTLNDVFEIILNRIVNFSTIPKNEIKYIFADTLLSKYENLILNSKLLKPLLSVFELDLEAYKEELRIAEAERIVKDNEARQIAEHRAAMLERWNAITNLRECVNDSNLAIYINDNLLDESLLASIETLSAELALAADQKTAIENRIKKGKEVKEFCEMLINLVAGANIEGNKTIEEVDAIQAALAPIETLLNYRRPAKAKELILAITDPSMLELKTIALQLYSIYGV